MIATDIQIISTKDYCQLQARVKMEDPVIKPFLLWYRFPLGFKKFLNSHSGNAFATALLLPAMVAGEGLKIEAPVSARLMKSISTIQDIFFSWNKHLTKVPVAAATQFPLEHRSISPKRACFFSGGVDSFYTLLKQHDNSLGPENDDSLKYLILVRGFDISLNAEDDILFQEVLDSVNVVAQSLGKEVLPVYTNLRKFADIFAPWGTITHGACLVSVGLTMENLLKEIYIGSTYSFSDLIPWGTHPLLDPLWSTENVLFVHDGCEANRFEKIFFIKDFPIVLKKLRVCFEITGATHGLQYNCGRCRKCLFTMIGLHISGVLKKCSSFPNFIDTDLVSNMFIPKATLGLFKVFYTLLGSSEKDIEIKHALGQTFERSGIDIKSELADQQHDSKYSWLKRISILNKEITKVISPDNSFILVDEEQLRMELEQVLKIFPFPEKDGQYYGLPEDDNAAINELERLRNNGAANIIIAWPAFWWLEHYKGWHQYLLSNFCKVYEDNNLLIFDLRK